MSQPFTPPAPPSTAPSTIPNNMVMAIIATVVSIMGCCLPHGLVSLMFAMQVGKKETAGDIEGANNAAKQAKMWAWISIIAGILGLITIIIISSVFGVAAFWNKL